MAVAMQRSPKGHRRTPHMCLGMPKRSFTILNTLKRLLKSKVRVITQIGMGLGHPGPNTLLSGERGCMRITYRIWQVILHQEASNDRARVCPSWAVAPTQ